MKVSVATFLPVIALLGSLDNILGQCVNDAIGTGTSVSREYDLGTVETSLECEVSCKDATDLVMTLTGVDIGNANVKIPVSGCGASASLSGTHREVKVQVEANSTTELAVECICNGDDPPDCECFSADATVQVWNKGIVPMKDLQIGDRVLVSTRGKYEPVYAFGYRNPKKQEEFLQIHTDNGDDDRPLEITPRHLLYVQGKTHPVTADSIVPGDVLVGATNKYQVIKISKVTRQDGIYAPFTRSGTIVVNGIQASTYASLQEHSNDYVVSVPGGMALPFSQHFFIHLWASPFRLLCASGLADDLCHATNNEKDNGELRWVQWGIDLIAWVETQSLGVKLFVVLPLYLALFGSIHALELMMYSPFSWMVAALGLMGVSIFVTKKKNMGNKLKTV